MKYAIITERPRLVYIQGESQAIVTVSAEEAKRLQLKIGEKAARAIQDKAKVIDKAEIATPEELAKIQYRAEYNDFAECFAAASDDKERRGYLSDRILTISDDDGALEVILAEAPEMIHDLILARFNAEERKAAAEELKKGGDYHIFFGIIDITRLYQSYTKKQRALIDDALKANGQTLTRAFIHGARQEIYRRFNDLDLTDTADQILNMASNQMTARTPFKASDLTQLVLTLFDAVSEYDPSFGNLSQADMDQYMLEAFTLGYHPANFALYPFLPHDLRIKTKKQGGKAQNDITITNEKIQSSIAWIKKIKGGDALKKDIANCLGGIIQGQGLMTRSKIQQKQTLTPFFDKSVRSTSLLQRRFGFLPTDEEAEIDQGKITLYLNKQKPLDLFDMEVGEALSTLFDKANESVQGGGRVSFNFTYKQIYCALNGIQTSRTVSPKELQEVKDSIIKQSIIKAKADFSQNDHKIIIPLTELLKIDPILVISPNGTTSEGIICYRTSLYHLIDQQRDLLLNIPNDALNLALSGINATRTNVSIRAYFNRDIFRIRNAGDLAIKTRTITYDKLIKECAPPDLVEYTDDGAPIMLGTLDAPDRKLLVGETPKEKKAIAQARRRFIQSAKDILHHLQKYLKDEDDQKIIKKIECNKKGFVLTVTKTEKAQNAIARKIKRDEKIRNEMARNGSKDV